MNLSVRLVLALAGAFAALALAVPPDASGPIAERRSAQQEAAVDIDLGSLFARLSTSEAAALTPFGAAERLISKVARSRGTYLGDLATEVSARAAVFGSLLFVGLALALSRRLTVATSDPRAPPLLLQHH